MRLLADVDPAVQELFGGISPPDAMNVGGKNPVQGLGKLVAFGINMFITIAGIFLIIYLLWGAFDWISSAGEKEKITKAQNKITNALIGIILVFVVLTVFNLLAGNLLGIVKPIDGGGFEIKLPTLGQ
jgi:magnesium-transporting ATPase (P-type)